MIKHPVGSPNQPESAAAKRAPDSTEESGPSTALRQANILAWLHDASNPYWDWFWGTTEEARRQLNAWMLRPSSEFSEKRIVGVHGCDCALGGYIALSGAELRLCRNADLVALTDYLRRNSHTNLIIRMRQARSLFARVSEDEFYLSRVGVSSSARGRGLGKSLVARFIEEGHEKKFKRLRLDVSADNERALKIYTTLGFVVAGESAIPETHLRYFSMVMPSS